MSKIVLNPFGSFGDLHPYLAIAIELKRRGHQLLMATSAVYRRKVEAEGIAFAPVRPDIGELMDQPATLKLLWDAKFGSRYLLRDYLLPRVAEAYEDLSRACLGADLLITHIAGYAGPIVAEKQHLRWISIALQPTVFFSKYDPPVLAPVPWARHLYGLGPWLFSGLMKLAHFETSRWIAPLLNLRAQLGLPRGNNPLIDGQFSPHANLALFSPHFARPQPDWPANTTVTGFIDYDKQGEGFGLSSNKSEIERFLDAGPPPIVFTLGSSAVMAAGHFFQESKKAARQLGMRAVLLAWKDSGLTSDASTLVTDYAPFSQLFPRAAVNVHAGGIGTIGHALRAGRPMMVVPWAHDQPDNAERSRKLGVSRTISRSGYCAESASRALHSLLNDSSYSQKAKTIAQNLAAEDGLKVACDVIEASVSS